MFPESVDGRRESGPRDAEEDVHPPGLAVDRRAMDAESGFFPQTQVNQQHQRQTRFREYQYTLYFKALDIIVNVHN